MKLPMSCAEGYRCLDLAERYSLSVHDSMIVASALLAGCETLWSEDMQDGLLVENQLHIRNPFRQQSSPA
jgi:predicted nucleic acid-binding protein